MSLNPSAPTKVGLEWMPTRQRGIAVNEFQQGAARFTPSGAVTGDDVALYLSSLIGSPHLQVDIIPSASAVAGTVTETDYQPNGDDSQTGTLTHSAGGTAAPYYVDVDESGAVDAAYFLLSTNTAGARFQFNTAAASGRPVSVTVTVTVEAIVGFTTGVVTPTIEVGGVVYSGTPTDITELGTHEPAHTWSFNPATGGAWTLADVQALDGTDSAGFSATIGATNSVRVQKVAVTVGTVTESRIAAGVVSPTASGWVTVSMLSPAAADTWSLASGTEYLLCVTHPSDDGRVVWRTLDSGDAHPAGIGSNLLTLTDGLVSTVGDDDTAAPTFAVITSSGPSTSDVSQVYAARVEEAVYTGRTVEQELTPTAVAFGWVSFVARQESDDTSADLTATFVRRDTGATVATATVATREVDDAPRLAQVVSVNFAATGTPPATQCAVIWSSTAASGDGWLISGLDVGDSTVEKLTVQQQGLEDGTTTGWAADTGGAIANSAVQARTGTKSLRLVWNTVGAGTAKANTTGGTSGFGVTPGAAYAATGYVKATTSGRAARLKIRWYDAAGTPISTSAAGADVSAVSTGFTQASVTATAPASAVYGAVCAESDCTSNTDYQYWDDFSVRGSTLALHAAGYGNGTDIATVATVDDADTDFPVLVGQAPATIVGVAVAAH